LPPVQTIDATTLEQGMDAVAVDLEMDGRCRTTLEGRC
jgi:hypothetical protein